MGKKKGRNQLKKIRINMKLQTQANLEKLYKIRLRKSTHSTQFELYKYEKPKPF